MSLSDLFEQTVVSVFYVATPVGCGTGFLAREDGLVLTNYHVVKGCRSITLQRYVGATFDGDVILFDHHRDLAAIRSREADDYQTTPPLSIGPSKHARVGQEIVAIGHPPGSASFSLSRGIVSAVTHVPRPGLAFLQANISINPGNSGGPLLSLQGQVIGMVTESPLTLDATGARPERVEGICHAIPADALAAFRDKVPALHTLGDKTMCCLICGALVETSVYCSHCGSRLGSSGHASQEGQTVASKAGRSIAPKCAACGHINQDGERYCRACGARLA